MESQGCPEPSHVFVLRPLRCLMSPGVRVCPSLVIWSREKLQPLSHVTLCGNALIRVLWRTLQELYFYDLGGDPAAQGTHNIPKLIQLGRSLTWPEGWFT